MLYADLTGKILEACFEVSNELGIGYLESVYEKALFVALKQKGLSAEMQVPLKVVFRGVVVGSFIADMIVEKKVLLELKAVENLSNAQYAQILNYLRTTGIEVGLVINFGTPKLQYRRFDNRFDQNKDVDAMADLLKGQTSSSSS
jgi:GxxExxY protein